MGKRAVLIGGSSAIGGEILRRLAAAGYDVLFTHNRVTHSVPPFECSSGQAVRSTRLDLLSFESIRAFVEEVGAFGPPDAFVNSAGVTDDRLCMSADDGALERITMIDYLAPAFISSKIAALMAPQRHGFIVHITSAAGQNPRVGNAAYGAAKIALERYTASLALELARFKVRTLCIAPAFVESPMFTAFAGERRDEIIRQIPMRQILQPGDVAEVALQFITGMIATTGTTIALGNGESVFS